MEQDGSTKHAWIHNCLAKLAMLAKKCLHGSHCNLAPGAAGTGSGMPCFVQQHAPDNLEI